MPTVLFAEDDRQYHAALKTCLEAQSITVAEALDGFDALNQIKTNRPDLILLDLSLPLLDGYGILKALKADPTTDHIPVIVLSSWPTLDNRRRAQRAGALGFVPKPYQPETLVHLVKTTLTRFNMLHPAPKKATGSGLLDWLTGERFARQPLT